MERRPVFVTGATGLVGGHLLYHLLDSGCRVVALRRRESCLEEVETVFLRYPRGRELWERVEWTEGDVLDLSTLSSSVEGAACVFHCAAVVSFAGNDAEKLKTINLQGTEHVASLCLRHGVRLCHVSSIAALGEARQEGEWVDEDTPVIPGREHSVYSHSKGDAEKIVWRYIAEGLNAVIVCPSIILGFGAPGKSSSRLYATAARGVPFYTLGMCGYVDVRDVCRLMIRLAEDGDVKGERFVLNGGNYSYRELFSQIAEANGRKAPWLYMRPCMTDVVWRFLWLVGKLTGSKPGFTKETARTSHRKSCYSSRKINTLYPDYRFYTLAETIQEIKR